MSFFGIGIGIEHTKTPQNVGTLFRSAHAFGAAFIFTIGRRYTRQCSDTTKAEAQMPCFHFQNLEDLVNHLPLSCVLVGVELDETAVSLPTFAHPKTACYLLGAEDRGLSKEALQRCHRLVQIPHAKWCLNVATAGSICLYDRMVKRAK